MRRSLEQAQDHHLLFLLARGHEARFDINSRPDRSLASHLRQILSEEFSIPEAELESLSKLGHGLTPAWRRWQFLGFTSDAPSDAAVSAAQTEDVRLQNWDNNCFSLCVNLTEESDAARLRPKNSMPHLYLAVGVIICLKF